MRSAAVLFVLLVCCPAAAEPLSLPQLIDRARANDHRVREAQAQLRYFTARYEEARWAWFPVVNSTFLVAGPMPEAKNNGLGGPPTTAATYMYDLNFGEPGVMLRAEATAVMPIFTFGKLSALEEAGKQGVQAGEALTVVAADEAEYQVAQAYYGLTLAAGGKEILEETRQRLLDAKKIIERLRSEGSEQVTQMDSYKLEYYVQQLEVQVATAEAGGNYATAAIRLLIDAKPGEAIEVVKEKLTAPEGALLPVDAYAALATAHRPELKAIAAGLHAREQEVLIRERMYYPDFGLAGFFRWAWTTSSTRQLSPFAYDPYNDLSAGIGLVMQYKWDFPNKNAQLDQARAQLEQMEHQRDLLTAGVRLEIEKAWNETNAALSRAAKQTIAEKNARRWATAAFTAFDVGTGDTRELVDSFSALAAASGQRAQAIHDAQVGLRAIARAIGQPVQLVAPAANAAPPPAALQPAAK